MGSATGRQHRRGPERARHNTMATHQEAVA